MKASLRSVLKPLLAVLFLLLVPSVCLAAMRIGVIMSGDIPYFREMHAAFVQELNAGRPAGENIEIILQRPYPDPIAWSNAARKLIAVEVDLIVTYGAPATLAVLHENSAIPVIYAGVYDPETAGIKGGKITGCGFKVPLSSLIRYFKRLRAFETLTVVFSDIESDSVRQKEELAALALEQKVTIRQIDFRTKEDLGQFEPLGAKDTVLITGSVVSHALLKDILGTLQAKKVVVGSVFPDTEGAGLLITLYQPPGDQGKAAASMAERVLRGEQPKNIVPTVLRETEMVVNLVEAQHIGITFPIQLIVEATRVIK